MWPNPNPNPNPMADVTALESPFLDEALRIGERDDAQAPNAAALAADSLFRRAFEQVDEERDPTPDEAAAPTDEAPFLGRETGVIDGDNRVHVTPTTGAPWRWICRVAVKGNRESQAGGGTGVLVSNRHVLTAAHVVYEAAQNMQNFSIEVVPALDYGDEPFDKYLVTAKPKLPRNYRPDAENRLDFDYALLELETSVGTKTFAKLHGKALGFWGSPADGANSFLARTDPAMLNGKAVLTAGYPRSSGEKKLMCAAGMLHGVSRLRRTMAITADTTPGQSGSPIWATENGQTRLVGIAVGAGQHANFAVRVTRELIRQLRAWITESGETPSMVDAEALPEAESFAPDAEEDASERESERLSEQVPPSWLKTTQSEVAPWATAIDPFPPTPSIVFAVDDARMAKAFSPVTVSSVSHLCGAVVDLTDNPAMPPYAGLNDNEMIFAGSLPKICAMYAAFALKARVQAFVDAAAANGAPVVAPAITRQIEDTWKPTLRALFPDRPTTSFGNGQDMTFPKLSRIFTFSPDGRVDFVRTTPALADAALDAPVGRTSAEFKSPPGRFHEWMRLMLRWSNNTAASRCILALGYFYLNGALARAGLFAGGSHQGLWLSADYAGHDWVRTRAERQDNAAGPQLAARWATQQRRRRSNSTATAAQVARFMTLLAQDQLVDASASHDMRKLMTITPGGIGSYARGALVRVDRTPVKIAAKIGFGDDGFSHDCAIIERTVAGKGLRYVAVGLGSAPARKRQDLRDLFVLLDDTIITRNA